MSLIKAKAWKAWAVAELLALVIFGTSEVDSWQGIGKGALQQLVHHCAGYMPRVCYVAAGLDLRGASQLRAANPMVVVRLITQDEPCVIFFKHFVRPNRHMAFDLH